MKNIKKCIYCKTERDKGSECVVCNNFICWDCLFNDKILENLVDCSECERLICSNCLSNCKCQHCDKYICNECEKICEVCKETC